LNTFVNYLLRREFLITSELVEAFFTKQDFKEVNAVLKKVRKPKP